jgi:acyl carrier protein
MNETKLSSEKQLPEAKAKAKVKAKSPQIKVDVLAGVKRVIAANLGLTIEEREELTLGESLGRDNGFGMDELDRVEIAFDLEDEFGIEISDEELFHGLTIGGVVEIIKAKIGPKK